MKYLRIAIRHRHFASHTQNGYSKLVAGIRLWFKWIGNHVCWYADQLWQDKQVMVTESN